VCETASPAFVVARASADPNRPHKKLPFARQRGLFAVKATSDGCDAPAYHQAGPSTPLERSDYADLQTAIPTTGAGPTTQVRITRRSAEYQMHFDAAESTPQKGGEMGWILETNTPMNRAMEGMGGEIKRRYRVYERTL
jgi:hypothetical protein